VKSLRLWLLVAIAVLLPIRGVMAAALPCMNMAHGAASVAAPWAHAHHHDASGHHHHPGQAGADKCNACASCCTAPPMMATFSPAVAPLALPSVPFPAVTVALPTFVSEGPERPPRSI
jgi:hypothetical protein